MRRKRKRISASNAEILFYFLLSGFTAFFQSVLTAQIDASAVIHVHDFDPGHVADVQNIFNLLSALELKILNLDQTVLTGGKFDPCTEIRTDIGNLSIIRYLQ